MREVVLIFPDNRSIAEFIVQQKINGAEVNSRDQTLTAVVPAHQIVAAETIYGAVLKKMVPKN